MAGWVDSGTETPPAQPPSVLCRSRRAAHRPVYSRGRGAEQQLQDADLNAAVPPPQPLTARHVTDDGYFSTSPLVLFLQRT